MFEILFAEFALMIGVAALVAALVNAGKYLGLVADGKAPTWALGLNLAAFVAFVALRIFTPEFDFAGLDANAKAVADLLIYLLGFVAQLGGSKVANVALRGAPVIGFAHGAKK
jgi:hypothetical protein